MLVRIFVKSLFRSKPKRAFLRLAVCALILFANSFGVFAVELTQYRANVAAARESLEKIEEILAADEETPDFAATARAVNRLIPARQSVEMPDKTALDTDNGWLAAELKAIESTVSITEKLARLNGVVERLGALENRLTELETAQAAASAKNDDKQKLNEILRRAEYEKPKPETEKSILQRISDSISQLIEDFFKWLFGGERSPNENPIPATDFSGVGKALQYLFIALAVALIGFVAWRFVLPQFANRRFAGKRKKKEPRVILGETLTPDQTAEDLLAQAENLASSGDVRAAIRKGYIAVLCELSDRKLLGLAGHKTNRDYLRDVRKREGIFQPMRTLTESFERHWYGETEATAQDWQAFRGKYGEIVSRQ